ncbi:MAG: hypothetical protein PF795_05670 [Kiritimatiellae bacterium]|jgi:hypothetical protein|nr:hypothetical protein [Kiritimatiellia bacterium]
MAACPRCRHVGALKRHGTIQGYVSPSERGVRAWRIYCNPKRGGCGHAPSVRLNTSLHHRCILSSTLWAFLRTWMRGDSIRAAWERAGEPLSVDCAYRVLRRFRSSLTSLRTTLSARGPPPADLKGARNPSVQTLLHLRSVFGTEDPIRAAQQGVQLPFLG